MKQKGFTLIELVLVIVILGILAAFIVPRFGEFDTKARTATVSAMKGSLLAAAAIAHAQWIADSKPVTIQLEGNTITLLNGYPTADSDGIINALGDVGTSGFTPHEGTGEVTFTLKGAPTEATCDVKYKEAPANGAPTVNFPSDFAGC